MLDEVAVACGTAFHADASPALGTELGQRGALDVAQMRNGDDHLVVGIEVLGVEFLSAGHDLGAALVAVLVLHLYEFVLHHLAAEAVVGEDLVVVFDFLLQVVKLAVELLLLQTGELGQTHVHDGLRLHLVQSETLLQVFLSLLGRLAALDDLHHLLDVVRSDDQTLQDVSALLGLAQVVFRTADDHLVAVADEIGNAVAQRQQLGTPLHQRNGVDGKRRLQRGHLEELVEHHTGVGVTLHVHHDAHTFAVALVVGVGDAVDLALLHQLGDVFDELRLVHAVRNLGDDDLVVLLAGLDVGLGSHDDAAATRLIGLADTLQTHDVAACGEVGTLDILHQGLVVHRLVVDEGHAGVNHLREVVCGDVGGHTYGDTGGAVDQQVGNLGGHHGGLVERVVEVGGHIHRLLLQVFHHSLTHQRETGLGVTHGCCAVAVHRAEVTLAVHEHVAHVPLLGHTHQSAVDARVAVGVILTQHLTHDTGTLLVRPGVQVAELLHTEEDASVYGFETIADIGQGTRHYHAHRVVDVAFPHLGLNVHFDDSVLIFHIYYYARTRENFRARRPKNRFILRYQPFSVQPRHTHCPCCPSGHRPCQGPVAGCCRSADRR